MTDSSHSPDTTHPQRVTAIVRVSARARRMRLVVLPGKGLELVVTPKTSKAEMEAFLAQNAAWAARTLRRIGAPLDARTALAPALPEAMALRSVGEDWRIVYVPVAMPKDSLQLRFRHTDRERIVEVAHAASAAPDARVVIRLLQRYVRERARHVLPPWVAAAVVETGLPAPTRLRIGMQRTLWGSRAANGTLSLSARLLFLPKELVRHVIIHELCHAGHMHHRASFQRALEKHDPDADAHRVALREAAQTMPTWCGG